MGGWVALENTTSQSRGGFKRAVSVKCELSGTIAEKPGVFLHVFLGCFVDRHQAYDRPRNHVLQARMSMEYGREAHAGLGQMLQLGQVFGATTRGRQ